MEHADADYSGVVWCVCIDQGVALGDCSLGSTLTYFIQVLLSRATKFLGFTYEAFLVLTLHFPTRQFLPATLALSADVFGVGVRSPSPDFSQHGGRTLVFSEASKVIPPHDDALCALMK